MIATSMRLSDWEGDWQSVYPHLVNGTWGPVMVDMPKHDDKSAEEYRAFSGIAMGLNVIVTSIAVYLLQ